MSITLACDCGTRFEVEDTLAGQTVACPECQQPIKAPASQRPAVRTSILAIASVICALVGAFTVVGTLAAVVLGAVAVIRIVRQRDRLAGLGFASFGIVAGLLFTGLTVLAFTQAGSLGITNWARAKSLEPFIDNSGPLEVERPGYRISRPSEQWGVLTGSPADPFLKAVDNKCDLALAQPRAFSFVDVKVEALNQRTLLTVQQHLLEELSPHHNFWEGADENPNASIIGNVRVISSESVSTKGPGYDEREVHLEMGSGRQAWTMLIHLYRQGKSQNLYILRCFVSKSQFKATEPDFRKAMDSFAVTRQ